MLNLIPASHEARHLLSRFQDGYIGIGKLQTWSDGDVLFVKCPRCGQPAVIITGDYIGGHGYTPHIQCLADATHTHFLTPTEQYDLTTLLRKERKVSPEQAPVQLPVYI